MKYKKVLLGISVLFPFANIAKADPDSTFANVEVLPLSKADVAKYEYKPKEYWVNGTDIIDDFSIEQAQKFYTKLYDTVIANYVKPITHQQITNIILEGLSGFTEKLSIDTTNNRILIYDPNLKLLGNFTKVSDNDTESWVNLLIKTILALRKNNEKIAKAHQEQIYYLTTLYLLKSLDENSNYIDPVSKARETYNNNSTSLGFTYRRTTFGIQVLSIFKDSPIYFSDIKTGDIISTINKTPTRSLTDEQLEYILTNTDTDILDIGYIPMISNKPTNIFLRKNQIIIPSITTKNIDNIPVLEIQNFKSGSAREVKNAIDKTKDASGIIIDLRGNISGLSSEAIETANLFISGGEILKTTGNNDEYNQTYTAKAGDIANSLPIIIIVDNTTKGVAEVFASIMDGARRAVVIGTPTFGDGNLQGEFTLPNNAGMHFATSTATNAKDISIDKIGVIPVVCTSTITEERDIKLLTENISKGKFVDNRPKDNNKTAETIKNIRNSCKALYPSDGVTNLMLKTAIGILKDSSAYKKLLEK
ncbi:MAG: hypothetical protein IJ638_01335 [Alphaproteobacteria bacterium]|nr:hypothetical protein [Alphaproteobacteria bacterium]